MIAQLHPGGDDDDEETPPPSSRPFRRGVFSPPCLAALAVALLAKWYFVGL